MEAPKAGSTSSFYLASGDESGHNDVSVSSLSDGIIQHTLKLYKYMVSDPSKKDTNIVTSPYSIWTALAITYLGSRKESSEILGSLLGVDGMNKAKVEEKMKEMSAQIGSSDGNIFTVANKIAIDQKMKIKDCVTKDPSLPIEKVDFFGNPEQVRLTLNNWVENKTTNLIKDLLPKDTIDSMTVMAILNAVYFKGSWEKKFNQKHTKDETFLSVKGSSQVQMMYKNDTFVSGEIPELGASYIDIPYVNNKFSMLAILPFESNPDIDRVVQELTPKHVQSMFNNEQSSNPVTLGFPRFEVVESCALKEVLSEIGAEEIFESINLSGIIESLLPIKVSNVFHKVFVKVDEEGTEAAGATAVVIMQQCERKGSRIVFNRPFAFILRDKCTDAILFMGVVRKL